MKDNNLNNNRVEILIVEDSSTQAEELRLTLERHNLTVSVACNGREALSRIRERKPTMVISDIIMPEMDGYQLCREIKNCEEYKNLPVILLTALSDPRDVIKGLECMADNFITKPYNEKYILSRIQYMLANSHLQEIDRTQLGVEIVLAGEKFFIKSDRIQILNLLLSSYEAAIHKNDELIKARNELRSVNDMLEEKVRERTADLSASMKEYKRAEDEIRILNAELEQRVEQRTDQLEAANRELEAFAYSVSHDLRAPLRSIDGFSQALLEDYQDKLDEEGNSCLRRVRTASQRMGQLIDDMLKLSRTTRGEIKPQTLNLSAMARSVVEQLKKAQPDRRVEFVIQNELCAQGDARLLLVVLENLLSNAWKFTARHDSARIEFGGKEIKGKRAYFVRDDGAGFDMEYADKLFVPFQRLHSYSDFEGTGIGLSIVQRILHRHGGELWAEGAVDRGATFYFTLPEMKE